MYSIINFNFFSMLLFFGTSNTPKTGKQISLFIFIVVAELIIFCNIMLIMNKKLNTFAIAGLSSTTFLYAICSCIFNILLKNIFSSVRGVLVTNFSILLVYLFVNFII